MIYRGLFYNKQQAAVGPRTVVWPPHAYEWGKGKCRMDGVIHKVHCVLNSELKGIASLEII